MSDANASNGTSESTSESTSNRSKSAAPVAMLAAMAVLVAAGSSPAQPRSPAPIPTLPLSITVAVASADGASADGANANGAGADGATADGAGAEVVDRAWIDAQVENANTIFRPHGVSFRVARRARMDARHARLESRADRHALGGLLTERVIDCFIVLSLRDVDEPSRYRQGVHWRPRGEAYPAGAHFVIVSSIAGPTVLAHELGHYFGNGHSDVPGNIMSYERGDVPPFFDDAQAARIRSSARRFLRRGELVAADALATAE
ncbi:MAG: M10 family metallopeptidase domain-containing protein [Sandaracinaceae bacterium]|nr:M10 family metallopeptidase domain-containing protein [Sandaracinaceae bacterium]